MANEERRKYDERIEEIAIMVKEIHQRQIEVTLPAIAEMKQTLYSRGGICETIHQHNGEIKELNDRLCKIPTVAGWIVGGVSVGAGVFLWIYDMVRKINEH